MFEQYLNTDTMPIMYVIVISMTMILIYMSMY